MADTKLSALSSKSTYASGDVTYVVSGGTSYKLDLSTVKLPLTNPTIEDLYFVATFSDLASIVSADVAEGDFIFVTSTGYLYERALDAASDAHLDYSGASGVKLYVHSNEVKAFGATGDGVTDDSTAIQAALDAKEVVDFGDSENVYIINSQLDLNDNQTIHGRGATINYSSRTGSTQYGIRCDGSLSATSTTLTSNATIGDFTISVTSGSSFVEGDWVLLYSEDTYSHYAAAGNFRYGEYLRVYSSTSNSVTFTTPVIEGTYTTGNTATIKKVDFKSGIRIDGLKFVGYNNNSANTNGIGLTYVSDFIVSNCNFEFSDAYAMFIQNSIDGRIYGNKFYGVAAVTSGSASVHYGVTIVDACSRIDVGSNHFERYRHGVITTATENYGQPTYINIHHNTMHNAQAGQYARSWAYEHHGFGRYVSFNHNSCNGGFGGINVDAGFDVVVSNNTFTNLTYYGIHLGDDAALLGRIVVSDNFIHQETADVAATSYGIFLDSVSTSVFDITISDNLISGFNQANSAGMNLTGNSSASRNIIVQGNTLTCDSNSQDADSGYGILCYTDHTTIKNNSIDSYRQGIYINSDDTVVQGNTYTFATAASAGYGIYVDAVDNVAVVGNNFMQCYEGIFVNTGATDVIVANNIGIGTVSTFYTDNGTGTVSANNNTT